LTDNSLVSSGIPGLDSILDNLTKGDNVVWLSPSIKDYSRFVTPFVKQAIHDKRKIVYFRFASHENLIPEECRPYVDEHKLEAAVGFESFTKEVYSEVERHDKGVFYVFDSLSDLLYEWVTDAAISNFFMVICPFLYKLETVAYFTILKNYHSFETISKIRKTAQVLIEVFNREGIHYVHPHKVFGKNSPTMFLPHECKDEENFIPIDNSYQATKLSSTLCSVNRSILNRSLDSWDRIFMEAEKFGQDRDKQSDSEIVNRIIKALMGRDEKILSLVKKHFTVNDLLEIKNRMIGTGFIGGKAVGMLLARKILHNNNYEKWEKQLEPHDSFYIGSDIFYTFIIYNGWWDIFMEQKTDEGYFSAAKKLENLIMQGDFPEDVQDEFHEMLDHFGQYPFIVRSSSLLEDGFGNAFAGKYESFFCPIQGTRDERFEDFIHSLKKIYASAMSKDALNYRIERGLKYEDEVMALLVQRVSGSYHGYYYYPHAAGVGLSYNTYVWSKDIDPDAGMLRIVMGLGTRAVNRIEGDYARIVALNNPSLVPLSDKDNMFKYAQKDLDVLDVRSSGKHMISFFMLDKENIPFDLNWIAERDFETMRRLADSGGKNKDIWVLTFNRLLKSEFPSIMSDMMNTIEKEYECPVDIEFTLSFLDSETYVINLVQCRPLQANASDAKNIKVKKSAGDKILIETEGNFMGGNVCDYIRRVIYIDPTKYSKLSTTDKHEVARKIGEINRQMSGEKKFYTLLLGPGRWGTTSPELGIPVSFSDINNMYGLGEIEYEAGGLMPELSFGTHFFQDIVESGIFYLAVFSTKDGGFIDSEYFKETDSVTKELVAVSETVKQALKVIDFPKKTLYLTSNIKTQKLKLFIKNSS